MIDVKQLQTIIENLITSSMREVRDDRDLLDSFSPNQFLSKMNLINHIKSLNFLNKDSEIVVFIRRNIYLLFKTIKLHSSFLIKKI